ncbi:hypothetical protein MMX123_02047 [Microbacterium sp. MM2322]|uniref:hypothetical protein n=1 Tax=Microbacterium sp. MM2322 TaxID=3157631 RepID=UPI003D8052E4
MRDAPSTITRPAVSLAVVDGLVSDVDLNAVSGDRQVRELSMLEEDGLVKEAVDGLKTVYEITDAGGVEVSNRTGDLEGIQARLADSVRPIADEARKRAGCRAQSAC